MFCVRHLCSVSGTVMFWVTYCHVLGQALSCSVSASVMFGVMFCIMLFVSACSMFHVLFLDLCLMHTALHIRLFQMPQNWSWRFGIRTRTDAMNCLAIVNRLCRLLLDFINWRVLNGGHEAQHGKSSIERLLVAVWKSKVQIWSAVAQKDISCKHKVEAMSIWNSLLSSGTLTDMEWIINAQISYVIMRC